MTEIIKEISDIKIYTFRGLNTFHLTEEDIRIIGLANIKKSLEKFAQIVVDGNNIKMIPIIGIKKNKNAFLISGMEISAINYQTLLTIIPEFYHGKENPLFNQLKNKYLLLRN